MIGRPKVPLVLTTPEQQALDSLAHRARTAPQVARRARIVLACARGLDNQTVAKKLRVSPQMVGRWRARFVTRRVPASGGLACSRIARRPSRCRPTRCWSRRCAMSSGCISTRPIMPWCCVSEKSQIQALDRTQPLLPMQPGQTARHTHTDRRHGTTSLFAALDAQSGQVIGRTSAIGRLSSGSSSRSRRPCRPTATST